MKKHLLRKDLRDVKLEALAAYELLKDPATQKLTGSLKACDNIRRVEDCLAEILSIVWGEGL